MTRTSVSGKASSRSTGSGITGGGIGLDLRMSFLVMALLILVVFLDDPGQHTFALIFVGIVLEALPFMLLGALLSGFVEVFLSKDRIAEWLPRKKVALTFLAAGLGVAFPVCECAIVPVVRRFLRKGVPLSAAIAYLLAGPIFNPVVGASTYVAYASGEGSLPLRIAAIRLFCGFGIAFGVGLVMGRLFPGRSALRDETEAVSMSVSPCGYDHGRECAVSGEDATSRSTRAASDLCCSHASSHGAESISQRKSATFVAKCGQAIRHGTDDFIDVTQYLVMGAYIAGLLQTLVSRQAFVDLAAVPWLAIPLMMGLAFVLNLCSEADAFLSASFRSVLPVSAQMAFMVLGPMLDIKLVLMYLSVFRKRTIVTLTLLIVIVVFGVMLLLQNLLGPWYAALPEPVRMNP